jgi:LAS superfamily LD-carboxypeptidase LdcB
MHWLDGLIAGGVFVALTSRSSSTSSSSGTPARLTVTQNIQGQQVTLTLVAIGGGYYLSEPAASAFLQMQAAAAAQGVTLHVNSAWRTNAQQKVFRDAYEAWLAAGQPEPKVAQAASVGWSNHEVGRATDIETEGGTNDAFAWLNGNAARFRFKRTVSSEPWHWEYV